jgi:hypothetical protein
MFKGLFIKKTGKRSTRDYLESPLSKDEFIEIVSSLNNINTNNGIFLDLFYTRYVDVIFPNVTSIPFDNYSKYFWRTECLGIESSSNKDKYWLDRGWSIEETKKLKSSKYGTCSLDYYKSKGYTEEKSKSLLQERTKLISDQANQTKKEKSERDPNFSKMGGYGIDKWLLLGYSEKEAKQKYKDAKSSRFEKIQEFHKENPNFYRGKRKGQIEYWTSKGFSEEEAKDLIKESQSTFTLQKCIEKYGNIEGRKRFEERQNKWSLKLESKYKNGEFSKVPKNLNSSRYSKSAKNLFDRLLFHIPEAKCFNNELEMIKNGSRFYFDFAYTKKIIEFNGDYWHCNPSIYKEDYYHKRLKMTALEKRKIDEDKIKLAESHGYEVLVIWESDYKENPEHIINKCLNFLNE